jgi:hypothetical protein
MTLLENPGISALPSFSNIKQTSEPIKDSSYSARAPSVTVKSTSSDIESDHLEKTRFGIEEHPIDVVRQIKVGIIGAGLAGITAGVLLPAKLPGLDLRIYDKNADVVRQITTLYSVLMLTSGPGRHLVNLPSFTRSAAILTLPTTGLKTHIRVFGVTYLHTPINQDSLPTLSGQKSLLREPRFETTGKAWHESITCINTFDFSNRYKRQSGSPMRGSGKSLLSM